MKYFLFLIFTLVTIAPAFAANYKVSDVRVDVEAETAIEARDKAMNEARQNAFNVLMGRMGVNDDFSVDDRTIATMVDSFEINREKLSRNRYLASVNVAFNERAVQGFLGRYTNRALPDNNNYTQQNAQIPNQQPYGNEAYNPYALQSQRHSERLPGAEQNRPVRELSQPIQNYTIQVNLSTLQDWLQIKQSLKSIGVVNIDLLNARRAVVNLGYNGQPSALQTDLNMKGLQLYRNTAADGVPYVLMRRG
jgi:hypothetical protein